eukprot:TRINITY_DN1634_c0_g1_i4.p1 TRINITY_DN1634_c0_g1~~TRINITY_DN1634_c0_g1_i4.p1  ORF type:complete len:528 (+),score=140.60 TRINITY_DN1634_c0_g1_i4:280-1863(+)
MEKLKNETGFDSFSQLNQKYEENDKICYLIFDEIQQLYLPENQSEDLKKNDWNTIFFQELKPAIEKKYNNLRIFMAAVKLNGTGLITSPEISKAFVLNVEFLYCTDEEMNELNDKFNKENTSNSILKVEEETKNRIKDYVKGHIGLIERIYFYILENFKSYHGNNIIPQQDILQYLLGYEMLDKLSGYRSLSDVKHVSEDEKNILKELYFSGEDCLLFENYPKKDIEMLIRYAVITLHGETKFTWGFEMMKNYIIRVLFASHVRPTKLNFDGIDDLIYKMIPLLNPKQIKAAINEKVSKGRMREKHLQSEIYRALTSLVPTNNVIHLELSGDGLKGNVDIYINGELQLAIELVVEDGDVVEHVLRFLTDEELQTLMNQGVFLKEDKKKKKSCNYSNGNIKNYAVVHLVSSDFINAKKSIPGAWRVQFSQSFDEASVSSWIRKNKKDFGMRGEIKTLKLLGGYLLSPSFTNLGLNLLCSKGNVIIKQIFLPCIPLDLNVLKAMIKDKLGLKEEEFQIFKFMDEKEYQI